MIGAWGFAPHRQRVRCCLSLRNTQISREAVRGFPVMRTIKDGRLPRRALGILTNFRKRRIFKRISANAHGSFGISH